MKKPSKTVLIRTGVTVAVLVAAIVAGSLFAQSRRTPSPQEIQLSAAQQSTADYEKAVEALSREETATALLLLERAVKVNPGNTEAQIKLNSLKGSSSGDSASGGSGSGGNTGGTSGGTATTTPEPSGPDPFLGAIELVKLLPANMDGYSLGSTQIIAPDATVAGEANAAGSTFRSIIWAVHDRETEAKAQTFLDGVSKGLYAKDQASVNVRGVTGYFGTDGTRFATVAFRRGRYVFEVLVTSSGPPADAKALAEKAAAAFPAAP